MWLKLGCQSFCDTRLSTTIEFVLLHGYKGNLIVVRDRDKTETFGFSSDRRPRQRHFTAWRVYI